MKTSTQSVLIALTFVCLAVGPKGQAVSPPPDGGYPRFNTAEGQNALLNLSTGVGNAAVGWYSLFSNTDGSYNTALGAGTLLFNVGDQSTGDGTQNTAIGTAALLFNTAGTGNTALGVLTLENNSTGDDNTAVGAGALLNNEDGPFNTAVGRSALFSNIGGHSNTAIGAGALVNSTTGVQNTALGRGAGFSNIGGHSNTALGVGALTSNTGGDDNTAVGRSAGFNITGNGNVCIGEGVLGVAGENDTTRIRNIYDTIQPVVGTDPDVVTITSSGRLGRANVSSRRYKHDIRPMDKASEVIYAFKPVSFRYKKQYDATQTLAFGLIAEQVAEVYPDLVGRSPNGEPESVRYEQINAMLLNEFLKEHRKVQELESTVASLVATVKEQTAQIQKVSAQIELRKPASQMVVNDQ